MRAVLDDGARLLRMETQRRSLPSVASGLRCFVFVRLGGWLMVENLIRVCLALLISMFVHEGSLIKLLGLSAWRVLLSLAGRVRDLFSCNAMRCFSFERTTLDNINLT